MKGLIIQQKGCLIPALDFANIEFSPYTSSEEKPGIQALKWKGYFGRAIFDNYKDAERVIARLFLLPKAEHNRSCMLIRAAGHVYAQPMDIGSGCFLPLSQTTQTFVLKTNDTHVESPSVQSGLFRFGVQRNWTLTPAILQIVFLSYLRCYFMVA